MTRSRTVLAVDMGGTKLAVGLVDDASKVRNQKVSATVTVSPEACLSDLYDRLDETVARAPQVAAIGIGIASMVDFADGRLVESTNLPLRDVPLRDLLARRYKLPVVVDNDATAACIGEHLWGAGVGSSEMLMITLGTGIGGGIICRGKPYRGASGAAAELGHMVIDVQGPRCQGSCPASGCLEVFASGNAIGAAALAEAQAKPASALGRALADGEGVDGGLLTRLAQIGDADALMIYERIGSLLGVGIASLVNIFNPQLVVIGGGAAAAGDLLLDPARSVVAVRALRPQRDEVRIVPARFGADAGLVGAAALAFTELLVEEA
jgi:glucokinase